MHKKRNFFELPFYFLLIGVFPVLSLYGHNVSEIDVSAVFRPFLFSLTLAIFIFLITILIFRNDQQAAIVTGVILIIFFTFGHILSLTRQVEIAGVLVGRRRYIFFLDAILLLSSIFLATRFQKELKRISVIFNTFALVLLIFPLFQVIDYQIKYAISHSNRFGQQVIASPLEEMGEFNDTPDIYYIILDMYTRHDFLKRDYGYDNSQFLDSLSDLGFYVADCSRSNYSQSQLSLASSLNMNYLESLGNFTENSTDRTFMDERIEHNALQGFLEPLGYKTVSLSAYSPLKIESAASYISTDPQDLPTTSTTTLINPFESLLIKGSVLEVLTAHPQASQLQFVRAVNYPFATHIRQQLFILDELKKIPEIPGPKFVFVHIQIPHPPYVFDANGEIVENPPPFPADKANPLSNERRNQLYLDQITFINGEILEILQVILSKSPTPPIIVLQGDHGFTGDDRSAILSTYYLPDRQYQSFYPQVSPVNSFRIILNQTFNTSYDILPDISYYSGYTRPLKFTRTNETWDRCK